MPMWRGHWGTVHKCIHVYDTYVYISSCCASVVAPGICLRASLHPVCVCVCVCVCVYVTVYVYVCAPRHISCMYTYILFVYMDKYICKCMRINYTHARTHAHTHTHPRTRAHTRTRTHTRTCTLHKTTPAFAEGWQGGVGAGGINPKPKTLNPKP